MIGKRVKVIVDRPKGSKHPIYKDMFYPINYGYIPNIYAGDGEEQDAYIVGIDEPIDCFVGVVIAIIKRKNDREDKWVVAPDGCFYTKEEIREKIFFQEKYFDVEILQ